MSIYIASNLLKVDSGDNPLTDVNVVWVKVPSDLSSIDSTKLYIITTEIDMGTTSVEVPSGGISISGWGTNLSSLYSTEDNYTLFSSPVGGSGTFNMKSLKVCTNGTSSRVYGLTGATGNEGFDTYDVEYSDCTSRGEITDYRQGFEDVLSLFGGSPSLTLSGGWSGGWVMKSSLVRSLSATMTEPMFKQGTDFTMASRFAINTNCDLPASPTFCDFQSSVFSDPSLVEINDCIFTRDGEVISGDGNYFSNLDPDDLVCKWTGNNGLRSTVEGGYLELTTEVDTTITTAGTFYDLEGVWTASDLEHFEQSSNNVLTHLGNNPLQYNLAVSLTLDSNPNDELQVKVQKYNPDTLLWEDQFLYTSTVNSLQGGRDVAFFQFQRRLDIPRDNAVKLQVTNLSDNVDITAEAGSYIMLQRI